MASRKVGSRKSTKKCGKRSHAVRSYKKKSGKKVRSHCSRNPRRGSRKGSRKGSKKISRKQAVKRIQKIRKEVADLRSEEQKIREKLEKPNCNAILGKNACDDALDKDNLRRCRFNFSTSSCEYLPLNLRERTTMQIGGSAEYKPYVAGERKRLDVASPKGYKAAERAAPGKIGEERKGMLAGLFGGQ